MLRLTDTKTWKKGVDAISAIISEGNFEFMDEGLKFRAVDPSQVAYIDFFMPRGYFDEYNMPIDKVGIDLVELAKVTSRVLPTDRITLGIDGSEVIILLEGTLARKFRLPLLDISNENIPTPQIDFTTEITLNAKLLKEAFKDAALFSSSVILRYMDDKFIIETKGAQGGLSTVAMPSEQIKIKSEADAQSKYSLSFLTNILKEADADRPVKLSFKSEGPLKVEYDIGNAHIAYYLAHMLL